MMRFAAFSADQRGGFGGAVAVEVADRDLRALGGKGQRGGAADAAAPAGDESRFSFEQQRHRCLLLIQTISNRPAAPMPPATHIETTA